MFRFKSSFGCVCVQTTNIYNCTATESEFIVYYGIWYVLITKLSYGLILTLVGSKKYIDQEPPYLMRQSVLQWEEIKTKNSGATHHF